MEEVRAGKDGEAVYIETVDDEDTPIEGNQKRRIQQLGLLGAGTFRSAHKIPGWMCSVTLHVCLSISANHRAQPTETMP